MVVLKSLFVVKLTIDWLFWDCYFYYFLIPQHTARTPTSTYPLPQFSLSSRYFFSLLPKRQKRKRGLQKVAIADGGASRPPMPSRYLNNYIEFVVQQLTKLLCWGPSFEDDAAEWFGPLPRRRMSTSADLQNSMTSMLPELPTDIP